MVCDNNKQLSEVKRNKISSQTTELILLSSESVDRSNIVGPLLKLFESRKESQSRLPSTKVDICCRFILLKIQF